MAVLQQHLVKNEIKVPLLKGMVEANEVKPILCMCRQNLVC